MFNLNLEYYAKKTGNRCEADELVCSQSDRPAQWQPYHWVVFDSCFFLLKLFFNIFVSHKCVLNVLSFVCFTSHNYFWIKVTNWMFKVIRKQSLFSMYWQHYPRSKRRAALWNDSICVNYIDFYYEIILK